MLTQGMIHHNDVLTIRKRRIMIDKHDRFTKYVSLDKKQELKSYEFRNNNYYNEKFDIGCRYRSEESFIVKKPGNKCNLYVMNQLKGDIVVTKSGAKFFTSEKSLVTVTIKEQRVKCGQLVYQTNQKGIYITDANTADAIAVRGKIPVLSTTARQYIDTQVRIHGVYQKLEEQTKERLDEIIVKECDNVIKISKWLVQNQINLANQIIGINDYTNNFMTMVGEVIYNFKCKEVVVQIVEEQEYDEESKPICYNYAKVQFENEMMFIKPKSRLLSKTAERIPCSKTFIPMYQSRNPDKFIKIHNKGIELVDKPETYTEMFDTPSEFNITHTEMEFGAEGGIYKEDQLEETEAYLTYKDVQKALSSVPFYETTGGRVINQDGITGTKAWSLQTIASMIGGFSLGTIFSWLQSIIQRLMEISFLFGIGSRIIYACYAWKQLSASDEITKLGRIWKALKASSNSQSRSQGHEMEKNQRSDSKDIRYSMEAISKEIKEIKKMTNENKH